MLYIGNMIEQLHCNWKGHFNCGPYCTVCIKRDFNCSPYIKIQFIKIQFN